MAICDNMRAIRRQKGLTQKQVANACGLADSTIRTYELGNANPKPATVAKIAKALGVTPAELYGVEWMPGITDTPDQEINSALYELMLNGTLPVNDPSKARLLASFDKLNTAGQLEAIKRTEEMNQIKEYQAHQASQAILGIFQEILAGFSTDEIEKCEWLYQSIQEQLLELKLMANSKWDSKAGVRNSIALIEDAMQEFTNLILKRFR